MKAILLSVKPEYVEKILSGEKTLEIRKTIPKCDLPCKVYIYESKGREFPFSVKIDTIANDNASRYLDCKRGMPEIRTRVSRRGIDIPYIAYGRQKIVAEFTLKKYDLLVDIGAGIHYIDSDYNLKNPDELLKKSCLTEQQIYDYVGESRRNYPFSNDAYAWCIDDLKIYDKPKELYDFRKPCIMPENPYCPYCKVGYESISEEEEAAYRAFGECSTEWVCLNYLRRPPQSWCYVERLK